MKDIKKGTKIVVFSINGFAMTSETPMIVDSITDLGLVYKETTRSRKLWRIKIKEDMMAFVNDGNIPFVSDGNHKPVQTSGTSSIYTTTVMRGNACINLVSDAPYEVIREFIEKNTLWPINDKLRSSILVFRPEEHYSDYDETIENILYPELDSDHAVILRAKRNE